MTLSKNSFGDVPSRTRGQGTESPRKQWRWLLPLLMLAPLVLGAKGCDAAVVGDDCPPDNPNAECTTDTPVDGSCGGLLGTACGDGEYCKYELAAMCGAADRTGVCAPIPEACDLILQPVCACDGATYGNECEAARKGVSVSSLGRCAGDDPPPPNDKTCGGITGATCERGQYCNYPIESKCGAGDQTGICTAVPTGCREIYSPVCGCDGKTYGNECEAASAGVSIISSGKCAEDPPPPPPDGACGGIAGLACDKGEYCSYPIEAKCGAADQTGVCKAVPEACDAVYRPVCGCDGKTYGNDCEAALVGVSPAFSGECAPVDPPPAGDTCGGLRGLQCEKGLYCNYPPEANCGRADATGVCEKIELGCTKELNPVCGCDGNTYGNPCMAGAAGVSIDYAGACKTQPTGTECGGIAGIACLKGEFCDYPLGSQCGAADQMGVCRLPPEQCTEEYAPVCGCNGTTYSNACHAAAAGVSVLGEGECAKQ